MILLLLTASLAATLSAAPVPLAASIRGQVTDATTGLPLRRVRVELSADPRPLHGEWRTTTDAEGRYRFEGLPPAIYRLAFSKARFVSLYYAQRLPYTDATPIDLKDGAQAQADMILPRASAIVGHVIDDNGEPVENAVVRTAKTGYVNGRRRLVFTSGYALTNDAGEYRMGGLSAADYYVVVSERGDEFGSDADADVGFAQTLYPSTTAAAQARAVTVHAGQDATGIDIALAPGNAATLSGLVRGADGRPAPGIRIQIAAIDPVLGGIGASTNTQADGTFSFPRLLAGAYELHARKAALPSGEPMEGAIAPVTMAGADVVNFPIALTRGAHITGRVIPPDGRYSLLKPDAVSTRVVAETLDFGLPAPAGIGDDGSFDWRGLIGARLIAASRLPDGWRIASVTRGADDIIDTPVVFKDGDEITITMVDDAGSVVGRVTDEDGKPVDQFRVILFVDDLAKRKPWSLFPRTAAPGPDAGFTIEAVPPGRYLVAAVARLESGQQFDPDLLDRLRAQATPIEVQVHARQSVVLKMVTP